MNVDKLPAFHPLSEDDAERLLKLIEESEVEGE